MMPQAKAQASEIISLLFVLRDRSYQFSGGDRHLVRDITEAIAVFF